MRRTTRRERRTACTRRRALAGLGAGLGAGLIGNTFATTAGAQSGAEATVRKSSGTWTATAHGAEVYSGGDVFAAIRAAVENLTSGRTSKETVVVEGDATTSIGDVGVHLPSYTVLDLRGTIELTDGGIPIYADRVESIEVPNFSLVGPASMGMRIRRAADVQLGTIELDMSGGGIGIRIDDGYNDGTPIPTEDVVLEEAVVSNNGDHAVETYGVDGIEIGTVETTDTGGCGLLLNNTANATVEHVDATRADEGGGYAGFRCANDAGPNVSVGRVDAVSCGRGVFTVSNSGGITIDEVHLENCGSGALLQDTRDVTVAGGTIVDNGGEGVRIDSRSSDAHHHTRNVTLVNLQIESNGTWGVRETGPDTEQNAIRSNAFCDNGSGAVQTYADSTVVSGNSYDCSGGTCSPTEIDPHLRVGDASGASWGEWQNVADVAIEAGQSVEIGPQPVEGGSWEWSGPGVSGSSREVTVSPDQDATYVATFTNDCGESSTQEFEVTVEQSAECSGAAGGSAQVDGQTVCDLDGDGTFRDVDGNGEVGHADVQSFFSVQHRPTWKQPERFDFNDNQVVGHGDVVALFEHVATGTL